MSSTDDDKLAKFWRDKLSPVAERLKARAAELLDEEKSGSTWSEPPRDVPELSELSPAALETELHARFEAAGMQELADIVPDLMKLAAELRPSDEADAEVDPFVYVMH